MMKKWKIVWDFYRTIPRIEGEIYNDERNTLADGTYCRTSTIISVSKDGKFVYSLSRSFELDPPLYSTAAIISPPFRANSVQDH